MSTSDSEKSPGGSQILRHEYVERGLTPPPSESRAEEVEKGIAATFGEPVTVFHEIVSDVVHLDVHLVPPTSGREWWTLFTTGMSDRPMTVPPGAEELRFAELMVKLPPSWEMQRLQVTPPPPDVERWYWPMRELKKLARLPHEYSTWLGFGHSIPNGDPPAPFAPDTGLCGWVLLPPLEVPPEARQVRLQDGNVVHLYVLHALHRDEMELKLSRGMDALLDLFERANLSEVLDPGRPSLVEKKRFGLFRP
jgi:hypothetical protein